jgi:hypothetical protein
MLHLMTDSLGASRVSQIALPPSARALCSLPRIDYSDAFRAETTRAQELTAEEWMRRILRGAPNRFRLTAPIGWFALGLRHGLPWSDKNLLGWPLRRSEPDVVLVGAESRTGMPAELLLKREQGSILFSTLIQLQNPMMERVWRAIEEPHRRIVANLVRRSVMGDPGFEPGTSSLSETRSNRLS